MHSGSKDNDFAVVIAELILIFTGVCKIFEEYLRQMNPHTPSITYDISELFKFVDTIYDMSCLV